MEDRPAKPNNPIAYIGEMAGEFAVMARRENRPLLVRLLEMVVLEAQSPGGTAKNDRAN